MSRNAAWVRHVERAHIVGWYTIPLRLKPSPFMKLWMPPKPGTTRKSNRSSRSSDNSPSAKSWCRDHFADLKNHAWSFCTHISCVPPAFNGQLGLRTCCSSLRWLDQSLLLIVWAGSHPTTSLNFLLVPLENSFYIANDNKVNLNYSCGTIVGWFISSNVKARLRYAYLSRRGREECYDPNTQQQMDSRRGCYVQIGDHNTWRLQSRLRSVGDR